MTPAPAHPPASLLTPEEIAEPITPEEAAALLACMTGHPHGLSPLLRAQKKLEAIADRNEES